LADLHEKRWADKNPWDLWRSVRNFWLCGKHHKLFERLWKNYGPDHIYKRMMDWDKQKFADMREGHGTALGAVEKIEQSTEKQ
jgi:hypothetical protein